MLTIDIPEIAKWCPKLFVVWVVMKGAARLMTQYGTSVDIEQTFLLLIVFQLQTQSLKKK